MILKYGGYAHALNEVSLRISQSPLHNPRGERYAVRHVWVILGMLQGNSASSLTGAIAALQAGYADNGQDLVLSLPDGVTPTAHGLISADSLGGTRVTALEFPQGEGVEYATVRTYRIVVEADFAVSNLSLLDYQERVSISGGGARRVFKLVLNGPPQEQITHRATTYRARQTGYAVGATGYPTPATPLWPAAEHADRRSVDYDTPRIVNGQATQFRVSWSYDFEATNPLAGRPRVV